MVKKIFVDYVPAKECTNEDVWIICHKCGECGRIFEEGNDVSHHFGYIEGLNRATRIIKDLPSSREEMILECAKCVLDSAKTKKGKWEKQLTRHFLDSRVNVGVEMKEATGRGYHTYVNLMCTNCRKVTMVSESILYKYCPHCGAAMEAMG